MKGEERPGGGADDLERRLRAALDGRSERVDPSPYAYRSVLRRAERARRARVRRRLVVAGAAAAVVGAVPVGVALFAEQPTEVVSSAPAEGLPRLQPGEVPSGFELNEVVDLAPTDTTPGAEDFVQVLEPVGRDGRIVARQSSLSPNQLVPPSDATQVDVNGSAAWLARIDQDRASLTWADNQTQVVRELYARGFSDTELVEVATSLRRRLDGPGFDVDALPVGFVAVDEGEMQPDEDPAPIRSSWANPASDSAIELSVRPGSPLELEMLRVTAPSSPLVVPRDGIERLLFTEAGPDRDLLRLVWSVGDAIVEITADGISPAELLDFASSLRSVGAEDWESFLAAAPDGAVIRGVDEPATAPAAAAVPDEPGFAVEGLIDGTAWRLSRPADLDVGACLTLQLGTPTAVHCLANLDATAVAFPLGDVTALVVVAPGDQVRSVELGETAAPYGVIDGVWVAWPATEDVPDVVAVELAGAGLIELPVGPPNEVEDLEPAEEPVTDDGGAQ